MFELGAMAPAGGACGHAACQAGLHRQPPRRWNPVQRHMQARRVPGRPRIGWWWRAAFSLAGATLKGKLCPRWPRSDA